MDFKIEIWNILHDGEITAIEGENTEALTMFINIPYLRRRIKPLGDSFILKLYGVKRIEFESFEGGKIPLMTELETCPIEILSCDSKGMPIVISTITGKLILDFKNVNLFLDSGQEIEFDLVRKTCDEYWTEWENNHKK